MDNIVSQQIPHDDEAEKAVLGAIFIDPEAIADASVIVQPEDFYKRANQLTFQAMLDLSDRGDAIDPLTLQDELTKKKQLEDIGGIGYVSELALATPTAAHITYYAKIVHRKALLRRLISASQKIISNAIQDSDDVTDIIDDAESEIMNVSAENSTGGFRKIKDIVNSTVEEINNIPDDGNMVTGLPTGFSELDKMTTGFHDGELVIVAARPGVGKTSFALNVAQFVGLHTDKTVAMFSLEMSGEQLVQRMLASEGLIDSQHLRTGQLNEEEWRKLIVASGSLANTSIYIDDTPGIKMSEIRAKSRRLAKEKGNLGLIVVDYLQLIEGPHSESRQQEVSAISRQLKKLAKELHVPVIALSQLSRSVEQRQDKRPVLSDIRESGSIEQDADIVSFLYRDDYYRDDSDEENSNAEVTPEEDNGEIEVIIEKNRSGSRGTVKLMFSKPYNRFSNLDYAHDDPGK
ncbi:replicative DNA helicase [Lactobacillus acetotolerans]|jgi:replicative DNA helicase|uniref:Replicative DNA helicase n=2 Tax=Lactobacillus acetotolerans TaxID=1600 RepID=A0A356VNN0_9LACO|nr:replicative DNA helicase [Lactobacillus acetotolerans]KRN41820.1 replicative DNA helicase DnaB [Lactobacillus acetotolerans DSM 20749 = JCM 3825]QFG50517.1 replicative DNA helicase [Lactobacillus acetotolerans]QJD72842.1 replicative DNA helicase [Lactobacillus acetotolerans]GGV10143.1 replicative DNA helicase [Lactobacillus acetotolerans DSM 20749 = JCM 3825]HBG91015.1 replicative DNA helicase [Lactobacillus acetotolerans]